MGSSVLVTVLLISDCIFPQTGIVIKASSEFNDFTNEIIVMVEITGGQLLPGIGFPILVEVFFPEGKATSLHTYADY